MKDRQLDSQTEIDRYTKRQIYINIQTGKQIGRQAGRQTDKTDRRTDRARQIERHAVR